MKDSRIDKQTGKQTGKRIAIHTEKHLITAFISLILLMQFGGCSPPEKQPDTVKLIKAVQVKSRSTSVAKQFPGKLKEAAKVNLAFRVSGPIDRFPVGEGQLVKKGQLIARIDPRDYKLQVAAAKAKYHQINAQTTRIEALYKRKRISGNDYDKAIAGREMAKANYEAAQNALKDTTISAPFDGYIQETFFRNHETVKAGLPVVSIIDAHYLEVETDIPASFFVKSDTFSSFSCQPQITPHQSLPLQLLQIRRKANMNQLYRMRLKLTLPQNSRLAAGMTVTVNVTYSEEGAKTFDIPVQALFGQDGQSFVWVYHQQTSHVTKQKVQTHRIRTNGAVTVTAGLEENQWIAVAGVHTLRENQKVKLLQRDSKSNVGGLL